MSRRRPQRSGLAIALASTLGLATGCGLLAPFSLGDLPEPVADGDVDADEDGPRADGEPDGGGGDGGEGDGGDADLPPFEPLSGCADVETEELWLVVVGDWSGFRSYLTGRDCADPEPLCEGCVAAAFSPSGDRAAAFVPATARVRVHDELCVLDLTAPPYPVLYDGFRGALPAWLDEETLLYVAAPEGFGDACVDGALSSEEVEARRRTLETGEEEVVGEPLRRGWMACCPVVSEDGLLAAVGEDRAVACTAEADVLTVLDLVRGTNDVLAWSDDTRHSRPDYPAGLLPSGLGLVVQTVVDTDPGRSALYAATFDGRATSLASYVPAARDGALVAGTVVGDWPDCAPIRRIGPACEAYCRHSHDRAWYRYRLRDGSSEPVDCSALGSDLRIMDVRQVPAGG